MSRAIESLEQDRDCRDPRRDRRQRAADQPDAGRHGPAVQPDHRQAAADGDRPADDPDRHQDRQRPGTDRRRDQEGRVQGVGGHRPPSPDPGAALRHRAVGRARQGDAAAGARRIRADGRQRRRRRHRDRRGGRRRVLQRDAAADQLHDGRPADDHDRRSRSCSSRNRSNASAITPRTSPRRWSSWSWARTSATRPPSRSAPRLRRNDADHPRRRGRAGDPGVAQGQPGRRRLRRAHGPRRRDGADAAARVAARPAAARLDAAGAIRVWPSPGSCARTRGRRSCR